MKKLFSLILLLALGILYLSAQGPVPPAPPLIYTDGSVELKVRVREINTLVVPTDNDFGVGFSPDEFTYKVWIRDNADIDGMDWQGGNCLTSDFNPPGVSVDFNETVFSHLYSSDTVPAGFDIRFEAWEDDLPSDNLCTSGSRCAYDCCDICCGVNIFGVCLGITQEDDDHCDADSFRINMDYRRGPPGEWFDHGYIIGSCGNDYQPRIESFWRYVNGSSCNDAIDLGTLISCTLSHFNSNESYGNTFASSPGNDVFYKFTITNSGQIDVIISLCNTASFDSYLYLLDSNCNMINSNDDSCGVQSSIFTILSAGTYYVVVDGKTASDQGVFTLLIRRGNGLSAYVMKSNLLCFGDSTGSAQVIASGGGTNPFGTGHTFLWSDNADQTSQTATGLTAGLYSVSVTDLLGCVVTAATVLTEPTEMVITITSTNDTCGGAAEGMATVHVSGGIMPYSYIWSDSSTDTFISNLQAGIDTVWVTDQNGCTETGVVVIRETSFLSGNIRSEMGAAIQSAIVKGSSAVVVNPDISDANGNYTLELDTGYCNVIPARHDSLFNNGISALDILLIRRQILGTPLNSPYKIIAADVDHSNSVSTIDILLIRAAILGTNTSFPGNRHWAFVPDDFVFADSLNPFPYDTSRYLAGVCRESNQDFIGIKLGDVNNSWDPNIPKNDAFVGKVYLKMDCAISEQVGEEISVPVRAKQFANVSGMQFTLSWDRDALTFQSVEGGKLQVDFATQKINEGMLGVLWTDEQAEGKSVADDEVLFSLNFIANRVGEECNVNINSAIIPIEVVNGNLELLELAEWADRIVNGNSSNAYRVYQNYPNPFSESTTITFELPQRDKITVEIYDLFGRKMLELNDTYDAGIHVLQLGDNLNQGVYYLRFRTEGFTRIVKMLHL